MPVLAAKEQPRPGGAALGVVRPLHLVEDEHLARARGHLHGATDDRRVFVDPLLAGDEPHTVDAELGTEPAVRLLGEHPQRTGVHTSPLLGEEAEGVMGLTGVRRAQMRDDAFRGHPALGKANLDPALGTPRRGSSAGTVAGAPLRAARALRSRRPVTSSGHRATVPGDRYRMRGQSRADPGSRRIRSPACIPATTS